jgi:hypothetical protein
MADQKPVQWVPPVGAGFKPTPKPDDKPKEE